jgi:hypothetical protein
MIKPANQWNAKTIALDTTVIVVAYALKIAAYLG